MKKFTTHTGLVMPLDRPNVDTDAIIPKQFLKSIKRTGFGPNLFDELRYLDHGEPGMDNTKRPLNPDFVLNQPRYESASILLARENFGCGSSREHAPWALEDQGFRAIIAPSYADIFHNNCFKNGLLPIILDKQAVDELFKQVEATPGYQLEIDLAQQEISLGQISLGQAAEKTLLYTFEVDAFKKQRLIEGLDDIAMTLKHADRIKTYEAARQKSKPWLF